MRLLIVKLSALGDVIQALVALGRVRLLAPGLVVDWAVDARFAPLLAGHPWLDRLHVLDLKGWWRRGEWGTAWAAARQLRAERYDAVADVQGLLKSRLLARLAGAGRGAVYSRRDDLERWRKAGSDALRAAAPPPHEPSEVRRSKGGAPGPHRRTGSRAAALPQYFHCRSRHPKPFLEPCPTGSAQRMLSGSRALPAGIPAPSPRRSMFAVATPLVCRGPQPS